MRDAGEITFKKQTFAKRLTTMLSVDFRRMFTMPMVYIMAGTSFAIPILVLVMTTMMGDTGTGAMFTNVWQSISSFSNAGLSMDLTTMCNMNLIYFLLVVLVCTFVSDDFRSGYAKNLFTVRARKSDYIVSKTIVCFTGGVIMIAAFFVGAMFGGAIAGLSFEMGAAGIHGIIMCMLSKVCLVAVFVGIYLSLSVLGKQKIWLSITGSLCAGMLLFMMIPMMTPLDAGAMHVILCLAGGTIFSVAFGSISNQILSKTSLV